MIMTNADSSGRGNVVGIPLELKAVDLEKVFGSRHVVKSVSFHVKQGEVVGLLGPNGAGKTTAFYMVVGLLLPTSGRVLYGLEDITALPMDARARMGIGYLPQNVSIFRHMTVGDNLTSVMEIAGFKHDDRQAWLAELLTKYHIGHIVNSLGAQLSGGERRRVEIARAMATRPKFLLLDEPFTGIDPLTVQTIQEIIKALASDGVGVLITDHNARETLRICGRAYILADGEIIAAGSPRELSANEVVRQRYFGKDFAL